MNQTSEPREERATEANRERTGLKTRRGSRGTEGWGLSDGYTAAAELEGLAKNTAQVLTLFALSNLWMARHRLLALTGEVRPAFTG